MKNTQFLHFSNTDHARNSASAVLDSYTNALTMSQWAKNSAHAAQMNSIDNAFTTGRVYSVDTVDGGRFYTDTNLAGNMFIGTQNSLGGFAGSLQIAGLIAHEGTHWYQYQNQIDPRSEQSELAAHAAQQAVLNNSASHTLSAGEIQQIRNKYNFNVNNGYAAGYHPSLNELNVPDSESVLRDRAYADLFSGTLTGEQKVLLEATLKQMDEYIDNINFIHGIDKKKLLSNDYEIKPIVDVSLANLRNIINLGNDNPYGEFAINERNKYVSMIMESRSQVNGRDPYFNMENIEHARIYIGARAPEFENSRRIYIDSDLANRSINMDGEITFTTGRELVDKINRFIDLGGKLQTLMVNAHGLERAIVNDTSSNLLNGIYYSNDYKYDNVKRPEKIQPGPLAANWNEIHWAGAVNNNFTLFMGACKGADDAKAIIEIIRSQNPDITGLVSMGRNYNGNYAGATETEWMNEMWNTYNQPMGLFKYEQEAKGFKLQIFKHPASEFLYDSQSNIRRWDETNKVAFYEAAKLNDPQILRVFAQYDNRSTE